jgi:uncharacterized membrane protein
MDLNRTVSFSLRVGVLVSAALSILGMISWAVTGFSQNLNFTYTSLTAIVGSAIQGDPVGLVYLAVIVLVATPIIRIFLSSVYFILNRDEQYVAITLAVFAMILFAVFLLPR